ncbi:MAG: ribosome biogenesis GTPase YqeH [Tenericutes bacterium]|jgi:ribosome biogenesis GTPase YqeH|nr:ribosome biogenesis GTPase YqeH [Mycoplasmatota bacterium]
MFENAYCNGCGSKIQSKDNTKPGYVSEELLSNRSEDELICQRCFRIKNYSETFPYEVSNDEFLEVVEKIKNEDALIVKIVDIFDFSGSFVPAIKTLTEMKDVILVGNKVDLLPKNVKLKKILNWLKVMLKHQGFSVLDCVLVSAKYDDNFDELMRLIYKHKGKRNVYIVGSTNVGKSKIINQILKRYLGAASNIVTESLSPHTTLGMIGFNLVDGSIIYDTPGVINKHQYMHYLSRKSYKLTYPQKEVKPLVFQLNEEQTLFFGGLARIDIISGETCDVINVVTYFSNKLNIHRTKTEKANRLYKDKLYSLLSPPTSLDEELPKWVFHEFRIRDNQKYDIVFSGLGFVTLRAPFHVKAYAPFVVGVYTRMAII